VTGVQTCALPIFDHGRKRAAALANALATGATEPTASFMRAGAGWMATVQLPEAATAMSYRLGESGDFVAASTLQMVDQRTGRPMINPSVPIAAGQEPAAIHVSYADLRGANQGPFRIAFDPASALLGQMKQMGELTRTSWLQFGQSNGNLIYVTQIASIRCGIREARIGIGRETPDRALELPPCDPKNPYAIPSGYLPYLRVAAEVAVASLEITWTDGTKSPVQVFRK
jgi:hypothetical protein